ncbi:acyl-CoA N-acyltransferase [Atractiella rhizophila]|nr:acyl-CoA N-acyltransferase [Atractiella rhizophila]
MRNIRIRDCSLSDLYAHSDPFQLYLHPHLAEFPDDYRKSWELKLDGYLRDKRAKMMVCLSGEEVIGVSQWIRLGEGCQQVWKEQGWCEEQENARLTYLESRPTFEDRSLSQHRLSLLAKWSWVNAQNPPAPQPAHWYCNLLCISPSHQRKGLGSKMMAWGMDRAKSEEISVRLHCTPEGKKLYSSLGFRTVDVLRRSDADPEARMEVLDADEMIWEPEK